MTLTYTSNSPEDLTPFAETLKNMLKPGQIVAVDAPMGAGKTTFISLLSRCFSEDAKPSSPTFGIVNEYPTNPKIFHFDCYRFNTVEEAY
ncbi:MAG: tRNA (adenosine(37)-N6)-threonylcarbamoyltransferase complex ATPase subunit type 1 TsaE, partial [Flavobacteriales bacterium]|nr:tRNA (adenosine(37)-N6)-threonylcarbamoyltransferase complex ATPase subunit type 1 TsaE [Flavobacteriales bacterium]